MKFNKKVIMTLSFCLGAVMFAATAFADMSAGSGYDQLKTALKNTDKACSEEFDSFTLDNTLSSKLDGGDGFSTKYTEKIDKVNAGKISETSFPSSSFKTLSTLYFSKNMCIESLPDVKTGKIKAFVFTDIKNNSDNIKYKSVFDGSRTAEIEKIVDAFVGNLKDHITVNEKTDGSKEISASINDSQIPVLTNTAACYYIKYGMPANQLNSNLKAGLKEYARDDISIKKASLKAVVNKDGIIENCLVTVDFSGRGKDGKTHDITIDRLFRLIDIDSTVVSKPDLTEKNTIPLIWDQKTWKWVKMTNTDIN